MVSYTPAVKLDDSFATGLYLIEGYNSPFRFDQNNHGGGDVIIFYVRDDIPSKLINSL